MAKVKPISTIRLATQDGLQSANLKKGVECELPPSLFKIYKKYYGNEGVVQEDQVEAEEAPKVLTDEDIAPAGDGKLIAIAAAIEEIMDSGDTTKLTSEGEVRTSVLSDMVGFKVSADERDEAMEFASA